MPSSHPRTSVDRRIRDLRRKQVERILRRPWVNIPGARRSVELLRNCLRGGNKERRKRLLDSPLLAGWIQDILFWASVRDLAEEALWGRRALRTENLLFDRIARTEHLLELVPRGRLDPDFAARTRKRALRILWERMTDLPRILLPHLPPLLDPQEIPLFFREIPDEGCPRDRIRLGESPVWVVWEKGSPPMALRSDLLAGSLVMSGPVGVYPHETIPGTRILVTHRVVASPHMLRVGSPVPGLARRLGRALGVVEEAWPRAGREIRERTWMVVPLSEPGTVSYSHQARPGISYINVFRGSLLDLADDLLHEAAHHRLHARQEVQSLVRGDPDQVYFSPWRRTFRPLNGILHGVFTFLYRAELFRRILCTRRGGHGPGGITLAPRQRRWLEAEAKRELANCEAALTDLRTAEKEELLTRAGAAVVRRMRRRSRILAREPLLLKALSSIL